MTTGGDNHEISGSEGLSHREGDARETSREESKPIEGTKIQDWYRSLVKGIEGYFNENGTIVSMFQVLMPDNRISQTAIGGDVDADKRQHTFEVIRRFLQEKKAHAIAIILRGVNSENDDKAEYPLSHKEYVELMFESIGFNKRYTWDIKRTQGKIPWVENGKEDEKFLGGNFI